MPKHYKTAELALRIRFANNDNVLTWYQRVKNPDDQITIWKSYPNGRYKGRVVWAAILSADDAGINAPATTHLHEYREWPNGTTCWLTKEEKEQVLQEARTAMA